MPPATRAAPTARPEGAYHASVQSYLLTALDGGTRVVAEPLPAIRSVALGLWIGTGSRDEDDAHAGVLQDSFEGEIGERELQFPKVFQPPIIEVMTDPLTEGKNVFRINITSEAPIEDCKITFKKDEIKRIV